MSLVGALGSPCSGKSTLIAKLFSRFKELSIPSEFVSEYARVHISSKRKALLNMGKVLKLTDDDQEAILLEQFRLEEAMKDEDTITFTDTSIYNSLLYHSKGFKFFLPNEDFINRVVNDFKRYDIIFYCKPVKLPNIQDPNRVHNKEQIDEIENRLLDILKPVFANGNVVTLQGTLDFRFSEALKEVFKVVS